MSTNVTVLVGNLGSDPESVEGEKNGEHYALAKFRIAVDAGKDRATNWIPVVTFGPTAAAVLTYLQKGSKVAITGHLESSEWETDDGDKRSRLEVVAQRVQFLDPRPADAPDDPDPASQE